jgi:hypothetical protein
VENPALQVLAHLRHAGVPGPAPLGKVHKRTITRELTHE